MKFKITLNLNISNFLPGKLPAILSNGRHLTSNCWCGPDIASSRWHWDIKHIAQILEISVEEANGFISCIEKSGTGNKKDGTWRSNPDMFAAKIDLTQNEDNLLSLHYTDVRNACRLDNGRFVCLEKISL